MASQCLPCERKRVSQQSHKIRRTTIDSENLFPQTEPLKAEGKEQGQGLWGSAWATLEEYPKGMTLMEQWQLLLVLDTPLEDPSDVTPAWDAGHSLS